MLYLPTFFDSLIDDFCFDRLERALSLFHPKFSNWPNFTSHNIPTGMTHILVAYGNNYLILGGFSMFENIIVDMYFLCEYY